MKLLRNIALATLLTASLPALAVQPFVADYQANVKGTIKANAQMTLSAAGGDRWNYVLSVTSPVASVIAPTLTWPRPHSHSDSAQVPTISRPLSTISEVSIAVVTRVCARCFSASSAMESRT